jgi:uncharacterized protein (DUF58 family)
MFSGQFKLNSGSLRLISKLISRQIELGLHASSRAGAGLEFDQYRSYQIGDDLKTIDWKKYMQSGKLITRQSTADRRLNVNIFLDVSQSMAYTEENISRFEYAKLLAATLVQVAYRQGDSPKISFFVGENFTSFGNSTNINACINSIEKAQTSENLKGSDFKALSFTHQIIVVISDFLGNNTLLLEKIKQWSAANNELFVFQILGKQEQNFDFHDFQFFIDLENNSEWPTDVTNAKKTYLKNLETHQNELKNDLKHKNINFNLLSLDQNLMEVLPKALKN